MKVILWQVIFFTKCFGTADKWNQVMKLIGRLRWVDFLRLFNQGSRSFPTDVKKGNVKIQIDKPTGHKTNDSDLTQMKRIQHAGGIAKPTWKPMVQTNRLLLEWCCSDTSFSVCHLRIRKRVQSLGLLRERT